MAKQSLIEARKAKALEEINRRLARIEAALNIPDEPAPSEEPAAPEEAAASEPEAAEASKSSRKKS